MFGIDDLFIWYMNRRQDPDDNREEYLRDGFDRAMYLQIDGPAGNLPRHEEIVPNHGETLGTPHQDPVVEKYFTLLGWRERRWYPLTVAEDGRAPNVEAIEKNARRERRWRKRAKVTPGTRRIERRAISNEDNTQRRRGVPRRKLRRR